MKFFPYLFSKKEKYTIDGREVILISRTKEDFPPKLREIILIVCRTQSIAQHFAKLTFVVEEFEEENKDISGFINAEELREGKNIVHLNVDKLRENTESDSVREFEKKWHGNIIHELTHLLHDNTTQIIKKYIITRNRLSQSLIKNELSHSTIRIQLFNFIRNIFIEGLAVGYQLSRTGYLLYAERVFEILYRDAQTGMNAIIIGLNSYYVTKKKNTSSTKLFENLEKVLKHQTSFTGYHLVYTILFIDHKMTLEKIMPLTPFEFIRKYEACMLSKGLQPVISLTSGRGIFDYKKTLQSWTAIAKELKEKRP